MRAHATEKCEYFALNEILNFQNHCYEFTINIIIGYGATWQKAKI